VAREYLQFGAGCGGVVVVTNDTYIILQSSQHRTSWPWNKLFLARNRMN